MAFNILLVDDSVTVRAVISKALHLAGVDINLLYQAGNGQEALEILEAEWIDLVLCDISMPVMDGETLVSRMVDNGMIKTVPVVIVSSRPRLHPEAVHARAHPRGRRQRHGGGQPCVSRCWNPSARLSSRSSSS
jgi:CheY-like chemotaxis protein